jgi:hypothetical protein
MASVFDSCVGAGMAEEEKSRFGNWLAGFTAGEGSFILTSYKVKNRPNSYKYAAIFSIKLRLDDLPILEKIKEFIGCGYLLQLKKSKISNTNRQALYTISNVDDLALRIIPLFEKYKIRAKKSRDFNFWKRAVLLLQEISNRPQKSGVKKATDEEIAEFTYIKDRMREKRQYSEKTLPIKQNDLNGFGDWLAGFVDGEGCFLINEGRKGKYINRNARFCLTLRSDDSPILEFINNYLGCGNCSRLADYRYEYTPKNRKSNSRFLVSNTDDLSNKLIKFFDEFPLRSKKRRDYRVWKKAVKLLNSIKNKRKVGRGDAGGWEYKWSDENSELFSSYANKIKQVRKYREPEVSAL